MVEEERRVRGEERRDMQGSVRDVMQELVAQGGETHISPDVMTVLRGLPGNK